MDSKTLSRGSSPLADVLPAAAFGEYHFGIVDAPAEAAWEALRTLRWSDLPIGRVLMILRGGGLAHALNRPWLDTFAPVAVRVEDAPRSLMFVMIGQPWLPIPRSHAVATLAEVVDFDRPGWLKYGMDWVLTPLPDGRTLLETRTLCEPTDAKARVLFGAYWALIWVGSRLIRREMLAAIARPSRQA